MPPKFVDQKYEWDTELKQIRVRPALRIEKMSAKPVNHGGLTLANGDTHLLVLSEDGATVDDYPLAQLRSPKTRRVMPGEVDAQFWKQPKLDPFTWDADRLHYFKTIWTVPVGFIPSRIERAPRSGALLGVLPFPPRLFYFPENLRTFYRIEWSRESEPVQFLPCDGMNSVLVENLTNGLNRFFYFNRENPVAYTLFDFSDANRRSDLSAVVALKSCNEFFIGGAFGLVHIRYGR